MRGEATRQADFMLAITLEQLIPADHPIRAIKVIVDTALAELSPLFNEIYARTGRPSIPPEHLLKGRLLMELFSIPGARRFCDQLQYNLLFKWFLDLNIDDPAFDASTFSKNQDRLLRHAVAEQFLAAVVGEADRRHLLSAEHFTVDGTLLEAWASMKSLRPKDGRDDDPPASGGRNRAVDFHGERRSNETHVSRTDPDARLARKADGQSARLCLAGHVLMENRSGLIVDVAVTRTVGAPEWEVALELLDRVAGSGRKTVGGDRGYDTKAFIAGCRARGITPHVAQFPRTATRRSAIDARTTRHPGYRWSQRVRKRIEEGFGWLKTVGTGRKLRYIGVERNGLWMALAAAAYDLVRMAHLGPEAAPA
jgi:transposase